MKIETINKMTEGFKTPDFGIEIDFIDNRENKVVNKLSGGFMCYEIQPMIDFLRETADKLEKQNA